MRRLRSAGILLAGLVAFSGAATAVADREEARPASRPDWVPGFSLSYRCADARDQLEAERLAYELRYEDPRWHARTVLAVGTSTLRRGCDVTFAVPRGSRDDGDANVTLERDGSPAAGTATVHVRPDTGLQEYALEVILPVHYDVSHSLGIGKHFFRFDFFGAGEAGSFGTGVVEVTVPEGYSLTDASPGAIPEPARSHEWTLRAGRDFEAAVTFRQDVLRDVVELAPSIAFGAGALLLALLALPSRREREEESAEPSLEAEPVTPTPTPVEPATAPAPVVPAPVEPATAPTPVPVEPAPTPALVEPAPVPVPAPAVSAPVEPAPTPAPISVPVRQTPVAVPASPRPLPPPAPEPRPRRRKYVWLGLLAIPVVGELIRRRRR